MSKSWLKLLERVVADREATASAPGDRRPGAVRLEPKVDGVRGLVDYGSERTITGEGDAAPTRLVTADVHEFSGSAEVRSAYEDRMYDVFRQDLLDTERLWRAQRVTVQREPLLNGKLEGFWHVTTDTGPSGARDDRVPNAYSRSSSGAGSSAVEGC